MIKYYQRIQEILKNKFSDKNLSIEKAYNYLKNSINTLKYHDSCKFLDFFMVNSVGDLNENNQKEKFLKYNFDYYLIKKNSIKSLF